MSRSDLRQIARDYFWLRDVRRRVSVEQIAARAGVSASTVRAGLIRARQLELSAVGTERPSDPEPGPTRRVRLTPVFGPFPFTPVSRCSHSGPIRPGSYWYCPVCHQSGQDHTSDLQLVR